MDRDTWYKSLCERRLEYMKIEAYYAKLRREVEKGLVYYHVVHGDDYWPKEEKE